MNGVTFYEVVRIFIRRTSYITINPLYMLNKKQFLPAAALLVVAALTVSGIAWNRQDFQPVPQVNQDTVPKNSSRDFDRELRQLEKAQQELEKVQTIDFEKMKLELEKSMKQLDLEKVKLQAEQALRQLDMKKMQEELERSLKSIDLDKIQLEIEKELNSPETKKELEEARKELEKARKEIKEKLNDKQWQKEMQEELKKLNKEDFAREMEAAKKEMEKVKEELKAEKLNMANELKKASAEMEKAKSEILNYQDCIYTMEKDGLLSTKSDYRVEYKSGEIFINEKKQPAEIADRYKKYFSKDPVVIEKKKGILNIRQND